PTGAVRAADAKAEAGKLALETWDAAYLQGAKAGYVHTTVREINDGDKKILRMRMELRLTVKRMGDTISLRMEQGDDETPEGKVTGVYMKQYLAKERHNVMTGDVDGSELHIQVDGPAPVDMRVPWNDKVVGMYHQQLLFQAKRV